MKKKGSGDELVVFLTAIDNQVVDALADRFSVVVAPSDPPSAVIDHCGFRRAHLVASGQAAALALDLFQRRSDLVQSLALSDFEPEDHAEFRALFELIDVPLLLINPNAFFQAMHAAVATSQLVSIDADPRLYAQALWSHLLRARASETQRTVVAKPKPIFVDASTPAHAMLTILGHRRARCFVSATAPADPVGHAVLVPHDQTAIAMAQGHWLISGRPQAAITESQPIVGNIPVVLLSQTKPAADPQPQALESIIDNALAQRLPVRVALPSSDETIPPLQVRFGNVPRLQPPAPVEPSRDAIDRAARMLAAAQRPLIVTGELGRYRGGPEALVQLAQRHGIAVVEHDRRSFFNFPTNHPLHLGFKSSPFVKHADVVLVVECEEPWDAEYTNLSHDPLIIDAGISPKPADVTLAGDPALALRRLTASMDKARAEREKVAARAAAYASEHRRVLQQAQSRAIAEAARPFVTQQFLSYCIGEAIDDRVTIWNDSDLDPQLIARRLPDSWFASSAAGWVFGAAIGANLANRDQTMVVVMSDESYLASEPLAAHTVANAKKLPVVVIVFNQATTVKCDAVAESCGAKGMYIEEPRDLLAGIRRAIEFARMEKRQVLVNVAIG